MKASSYLDGQMLIAMPSIGDPRFERSLIYLCAHSDNGAMGIIVNKRSPMISFADLLDRLEVIPDSERIKLPHDVSDLQVQFGGPVEPARGFVLHTSDYFSAETTLPIDERVALTATLDILRAIAGGQGPRRVCWRSAMPAGGQASSRARSITMAGCIARPTRICCSAATSTASTRRIGQDRRRSVDAVGRGWSRLA